jgi:divalent metal cation (Fe/Co/Zn/Cd) transporter
LRTAVRESNHVKDPKTGWWTFIRRTKQPELPVVLLEDIGALIGLIFALAGVVLSQVTGNPRWDAMGSVMIGLLLIVIAIVLIVEMKSLLIGESASPTTQDAIVTAITSTANVDQLIHMRTEHLGPDEILVGAKIEYSSALSADELVAAINATEDAIRATTPSATVIYLEPDRVRTDHPELRTDTPSS